MGRLEEGGLEDVPATTQPRLTRREVDVLAELCRPIIHADDIFTEPASIREIAERLFVSDAAVKQHLLRLYDKFGIWESGRRRVGLANAALRSGAVRLPGSETAGPQGDPVPAGRAASVRRDWDAAFDLFREADTRPGGALGAEDLERLGEAGWFSDHHQESDSACLRAHAAYLERGDRESAARVAVMLAYHSMCRLNLAIAAGWIKRGTR